MCEKEKKKEEETILDHVCHHHPLSLTECSEHQQCYGCRRYIFSGETVYKCHKKCGSALILHEECAEMPGEIRLLMHDPQHTLIQKEVWYVPECAVCKSDIFRNGYYCSSCKFKIHVGCAPNVGLSKSCIDHPAHPHQLTLQRRPGRSCSSRCDACGNIHKGSPYVCADCQYWVLESCANLPADADYPHLHHHRLSLAFNLPPEYIKFNFSCSICFKGFLPKYWVYHCEICRYVVHINCAVRETPAAVRSIDIDKVAEENAIAFPINNVGEELIGAFAIKVGGAKAIPSANEIATAKYKFHNHDHELRLISLSLQNQEEEDEEEEEKEGDDDYDLNSGKKSELICDGCTTPIFKKKQKSECNYYMRCGECKYFLHWACFNLPPEIPSHPLHLQPDHTLILRTPPKLDLTYCNICRLYTNGLIYGCTKCSFKIDIKCASLPASIKHEAHRSHLLKLLGSEMTTKFSNRRRLCYACGTGTYNKVCYKCDVCEIILHSSCVLLPTTVSNPTWDRHPLPLTFDASVDHPSSFHCDVCEEEMSPKWWMYHCRTCDFSFHPSCFPAASGQYKNIVFGQQYDAAAVHHHPLVYQLLTSKLHCDVCRERKDYGCRGFQCASKECDFFMCFFPCATRNKYRYQAIHQFRLIDR